MKTLYSSPFLTLYLHAGKTTTLETSWRGYASSTEFRQAVLQSLALASAHHVHAWIADDRQLGAVRPRDLDWVIESVLVPLATLGIRRFAHLESQDALNRRTIHAMYEQAGPVLPYEVRRFDDIDQARAWATDLAT